MKFLVLFLLVSANGCLSNSIDEVEPYSAIRDLIEEFLRQIKELVPNEVSLAEREIIDVETEYASANVIRTESVIEGLSQFDVDVEYTGILIPVPNAVTIQYSRLLTHSKYLSRFGLNIFPEGVLQSLAALESIISHTVLNGAVEFSLTPLNLQIKNLQLRVEALEVEAQGLLDSDILSRLVSVILTRYGADLVNTYSEILATVVTEVINDFLSRYFPISSQIEYYENVDLSNYSKEELDARAQALKTGLDNIINDLRYILN